MNRREFTLMVLASAAVAQWPLTAAAQAISNLKMMIPANPGGGWDQTGRALAAAMQQAKVVQSVQFDNKGGAAGTIGLAQFVNSARGDPNAVLVGRHGDGRRHHPQQVAGRPANGDADCAPDQRIHRHRGASESPYKTMGDLVKALKADPGKVSWNGGSAGGSDHILIGLIAQCGRRRSSQGQLRRRPKAAASRCRDHCGGHVTAGVAGLSEFAEHIKGGRMRALAVSAPQRLDGIPSLKEQGIDVVLGNWRGVFGAPAYRRAARRPGVRGQDRHRIGRVEGLLAKFGWESVLGGDAFKAFLDEDIKRIGAILESLGLRK